MLWQGLETRYREECDFFKTSQGAFRIEHMLRQFYMQQWSFEERKSQQRPRVHVVKILFAGEDNPTLVIHRLNTNEKDEDWSQTKKFHTRVVQ